VEPVLEQFAAVRPGQLLAGKYCVEHVIGVGGMGVVVAARHVELDRRVAIKFLLPSLLSRPEAVARFAGEARNSVKIQNEHVARVLDVGVLEDGLPYMVMELLEGEDLATWLDRRGPLPIELAVEFVLQACVAVADAHGLGIVHRDLKPANLFCVRRSDGQHLIKVLDFGISKLTGDARASAPPAVSLTRTSAVLGSPFYMSPEQVLSARDVDSRADLWALGALLFELLTGDVPFPGEAFAEVAVKIVTREPASLRRACPEIPPELEAVILTCLAKDRRCRYATAAQLAAALAPFAPERARGLVDRIAGILHAARMPVDPPPPAASSPHGDRQTTTQLTASRARRKRAMGAAVLLFGVVASVGAVAAVRRTHVGGNIQPALISAAPSRAALLGASIEGSSLPPTAPLSSLSPTSEAPPPLAATSSPTFTASSRPPSAVTSPRPGRPGRRPASQAPPSTAAPQDPSDTR
jgi:serine/threonine-protein kinase